MHMTDESYSPSKSSVRWSVDALNTWYSLRIQNFISDYDHCILYSARSSDSLVVAFAFSLPFEFSGNGGHRCGKGALRVDTRGKGVSYCWLASPILAPFRDCLSSKGRRTLAHIFVSIGAPFSGRRLSSRWKMRDIEAFFLAFQRARTKRGPKKY